MRKLQPAIDELTEVGFLEDLSDAERYKREGKNWTILLVKKGATGAPAQPPSVEATSPSPLVAALVERGVTHKTAGDLAGEHPAAYIQDKLDVFDWLVAKKDRRVQKSPAGYLVSSLRENYETPKGFVSKAELTRMEESRREAARKAKEKRVREAEQEARERAEDEAIWKRWESLGRAEQDQIDQMLLASEDPKLVENARPSHPLGRILLRSLREKHLRTLLGFEPRD